MSDEPVIGGYRRVSIIQSGQNSDVWEVVDVATGKQKFAMKILISSRQQDKLQRASLRREARISTTLNHPNIIRFHKYVADRKHPYILMEFFPSSNLKLLQMRDAASLRARLPRILAQACQALEYVHRKGYVHRDVKPDNFLVSRGGDVRLIDFALTIRATGVLARLFHRPQPAAGTRSYISPEQIQGAPIDARADVYSFGVMMFELLTGRLPFMAPTGAELLRKHLKAEAPSLPAEAGITARIAELVQQMMAKKPDDRPGSMSDIASEMTRHGLFRDDNARKA